MYCRGNVARPQSAHEGCVLLQSKSGCTGSHPGGLWQGAWVTVPSPGEYTHKVWAAADSVKVMSL